MVQQAAMRFTFTGKGALSLCVDRLNVCPHPTVLTFVVGSEPGENANSQMSARAIFFNPQSSWLLPDGLLLKRPSPLLSMQLYATLMKGY